MSYLLRTTARTRPDDPMDDWPKETEEQEEWREAKSFAERADDRFLRFVRSAGRGVRTIERGGAHGVAAIMRTFRRSESREEPEAHDDDLDAAAADAVWRSELSDELSPGAAPDGRRQPTASEPPEAVARTKSKRSQAKSDARPSSEGARSPLEASTLLAHHPLADQIDTPELRNLLQDFLHGTDAARGRARRVLAQIGRKTSEPLFVGALRGAPP